MTTDATAPEALRPTQQNDAADASSVAILDQALWRDLNNAKGEQRFGEAWLALLCRMISGATAAVLVLERGPGQLTPVAGFPPNETGNAELLATAQLAVTERRGALRAPTTLSSPQPTRLAYPILLEDHLVGAVALELTGLRDNRQCMRQLQWAVAWVRDFLRRQTADTARSAKARMSLALDLLAAALEEERSNAACRVAATELAARLGCIRVSFGFLRRGQSEVESISHSAQFGKQMNLVQLLAKAMDEAIDQHSVVLYPSPEHDDVVLTQAHAALASGHGAGHILTVPMFVKDRFVGAVTFERELAEPFDQSNVDVAEAVVSILGPALTDKRANDRWLIVKLADSVCDGARALLGPGHIGSKLTVVASVLVLAFCYFATGPYQIVADGKVEGEVQRSIVAPFDGYISEASAQAGDSVKKDQLIAALNDRDIVLERLRWLTERQQHLYEYDKALSDDKRADAERFKSQLDQAEAQVRLTDEELKRSRLLAPFDGLILSGDLTQSIGAAVHRGDLLFRIAPLSNYRVRLLVPESQVADVAPGETGELVVAALPDTTFPFTVERITPVATAQDGKNFFAVDGRLTRISTRLRPGMDGVGKIDGGDRRLVWIWFRSLLHWLRITSWSWLS